MDDDLAAGDGPAEAVQHELMDVVAPADPGAPATRAVRERVP